MDPDLFARLLDWWQRQEVYWGTLKEEGAEGNAHFPTSPFHHEPRRTNAFEGGANDDEAQD